MSEVSYQVQLFKKLDQHFNEEELRTVCFSLGVQYDNLGGRGKKSKTRELIERFVRENRLQDLVGQCREERPDVTWNYQARILICCEHHTKMESQFVRFLHQSLSQKGHDIFLDRDLRHDSNWLDEVVRHIETADYVIVMLSGETVSSEMLKKVVSYTKECQEKQGQPIILPIRINYTANLPYSIAEILDPAQYVLWRDQRDSRRAIEEISAVVGVNGNLLPKPSLDLSQLASSQIVAEDGHVVSENETPQPLPEYDPRFLGNLSAPGGTVRLRDDFYIRRTADANLERQLNHPGSIITIRGPRQIGKSSLLVRGIHHARNQGCKVIHLDLQRVDLERLNDPETFLRFLADFIARKLHLDNEKVDAIWNGSILGPLDCLTYLLEDYVLLETTDDIVLAIDEVDRLLETEFHTAFFGLMRAWHNIAAYDDNWERFNLILAISTEPYLLIADPHQSPFNVGLKVYLEDFTWEQTQTLNSRHGEPVPSRRFTQFMETFNGHPYLTRKALYTLVTERPSWNEFFAFAPTDQGPFGDHLGHHLWLLREEESLQKGLKEVLLHQRCSNEEARYRLRRAGLIKTIEDNSDFRCRLYRQYFKDRL